MGKEREGLQKKESCVPGTWKMPSIASFTLRPGSLDLSLGSARSTSVGQTPRRGCEERDLPRGGDTDTEWQRMGRSREPCKEGEGVDVVIGRVSDGIILSGARKPKMGDTQVQRRKSVVAPPAESEPP